MAALPALLLAACGGGGGGGVASLPPPPPPPSTPPPPSAPTITTESTPLPRTPALTAGTYGAIALVQTQLSSGVAFETTPPGEVRITVDPATRSYTVTAPSVEQYLGKTVAVLTSGFGEHVVTTSHNPDGSTETSAEDIVEGAGGFTKGTQPADVQQFSLVSAVGLSHVSYGAWAYVLLGTRSEGTMYAKEGPTIVYFAYGDRTLTGDIPLSGTAQYAVGVTRNSAENGWTQDGLRVSVPDFILTADFGARSISALFDAPPQISYDDWSGGESYTTGFYAAGTAPFTAAGDFTIALAGALTQKSMDPKVTDVVTSLTGGVDGAFFGPQASEIGGVFHFSTPDGKGTGGAFAGSRN